MTTTRDLAFTPATELARLYRRRAASPLEVMQAALARIDAVNPQVNAFVTLARDEALREARRATAAMRRGKALPPLFGVPVGIKDVTQTKGILTTYGSTLYKDHVPDVDALVVERLRAAGAIVLGKTNTPEFAFGPNTVNAVFGATRNPWNLAAPPAARAAGPRRRWRRACVPSPKARISAARCAGPRPIAAWWASGPRRGSSRATPPSWPGTRTPSRARWPVPWRMPR